MNHPIFDGECHAISEEYAYIASTVQHEGNNCVELETLQSKIDQHLAKYAEYLVNQDKQKAIGLLTDVFRAQVMRDCTPEYYKLIHRPPWMVCAFAQYGTLALKFKRSENDNLDKKSESVRKNPNCRC